jgi:predicted HTH transcriptional regulator
VHCRAVAYLKTLDQETHYKLLRYRDENPSVTQRELSQEPGVSLGKVNYSLKALISRGLVKVRNFKNSGNKRAYLMYNNELYDLRREGSI